MTGLSTDRLAELVHEFHKRAECARDEIDKTESLNVASGLMELQQWRSGVDPETGSPIGRLVVMEPWTDQTE